MPHDPEKAAERNRRFRARQKEAAGLPPEDMRGRHANHVKGPAHARWTEERQLSDDGYVILRVGRDHPLSDPNGYAYEHLVVWVSAGHPAPAPDEILHHVNEHRTDNRLKNLELMKRGPHNAHHLAGRGRSESGRFLPKAPR